MKIYDYLHLRPIKPGQAAMSYVLWSQPSDLKLMGLFLPLQSREVVLIHSVWEISNYKLFWHLEKTCWQKAKKKIVLLFQKAETIKQTHYLLASPPLCSWRTGNRHQILCLSSIRFAVGKGRAIRQDSKESTFFLLSNHCFFVSRLILLKQFHPSQKCHTRSPSLSAKDVFRNLSLFLSYQVCSWIKLYLLFNQVVLC